MILRTGSKQAYGCDACEFAPQRSIIAGRAKGGAGPAIKLGGSGISRTVVVAADKTYSFVELPADRYTITILGSDPPTGSTQIQADIRVDALILSIWISMLLCAAQPR